MQIWLFLLLSSFPTTEYPGDDYIPPCKFGSMLEGGLGIGTTSTGQGSFFDGNLHLGLHIKLWEEYSFGFGGSVVFGSGKTWVEDDPETPDEDESIQDDFVMMTYFIENRFYLEVSPSFFIYLSAKFGGAHLSADIYPDTYSDPENFSGSVMLAGFGAGFRTYITTFAYLYLNSNYQFYFQQPGTLDLFAPHGSFDLSLGLGLVM